MFSKSCIHCIIKYSTKNAFHLFHNCISLLSKCVLIYNTAVLKSRSTDKQKVRGQKTIHFGRNPKRCTISKKEQPKTAQNEITKIQTDQMSMASLTSSFSVERDLNNNLTKKSTSRDL